jgi:calcineurin-like phosphoesterase family protein
MAIAGLYKIFDHWHATGTVWIYSDPHFSDKDLAVGQPNRPADAEQIENINRKVGRKDTLIILGDVGDIEAAKKLRGYKILIMGNHDSGRTNYERQIITRKFPQEIFQEDEALLEMQRIYPGCRYTISDEYDFEYDNYVWAVKADNMLFDEVYEGPLMISEKLILSHEPVDVPWAFNIHGHVHDLRHKNDKRHFNVCAEAINFTPINFNQWMKQGHFSRIETIHRSTIDTATERKRKRGGKKING